MSKFIIKQPARQIVTIFKAYDKLIENPNELDKLKLKVDLNEHKNIAKKFKAILKDEEVSAISKSVSTISSNQNQNMP